MTGRRRWALGCASVVLAGAITLGLVWLLRPDTQAVQLRDHVTVAGYRQTATIDGTHDQGDMTEALGIYVGPALHGDVGQVVSGPGLALTGPPSRAGSAAEGLDDWIAIGHFPNGCSAHVLQLRRDKSPPDDWKVSESDLADFRAGRRDVLEVWVGCHAG